MKDNYLHLLICLLLSLTTVFSGYTQDNLNNYDKVFLKNIEINKIINYINSQYNYILTKHLQIKHNRLLKYEKLLISYEIFEIDEKIDLLDKNFEELKYLLSFQKISSQNYTKRYNHYIYPCTTNYLTSCCLLRDLMVNLVKGKTIDNPYIKLYYIGQTYNHFFDLYHQYLKQFYEYSNSDISDVFEDKKIVYKELTNINSNYLGLKKYLEKQSKTLSIFLPRKKQFNKPKLRFKLRYSEIPKPIALPKFEKLPEPEQVPYKYILPEPEPIDNSEIPKPLPIPVSISDLKKFIPDVKKMMDCPTKPKFPPMYAEPVKTYMPKFIKARLKDPSQAHFPYPIKARKLGLEGHVKLGIDVDDCGRVITVKLVRSSGHRILDRAALTGAKKWIFIPARLDDVCVPDYVEQVVIFRLYD